MNIFKLIKIKYMAWKYQKQLDEIYMRDFNKDIDLSWILPYQKELLRDKLRGLNEELNNNSH